MGAQKVSPGLLPPPPRYPGITCRKTKNLRFFRSQISDLRENTSWHHSLIGLKNSFVELGTCARVFSAYTLKMLGEVGVC